MREPLVAVAQYARRLPSLLLLLFMLSCGSPQDEVELRAVSQAANARVVVKRDAVFVISADPLNVGGACSQRDLYACTPIVPTSEDFTNNCGSCAGTRHFDAQVRGVVRALESLRELDGSIEVSVIIDTSGVISEWKNNDAPIFGSRHAIFSGPHVLLSNVPWTKQTAPSSIALVRSFAMQELLHDQETPLGSLSNIIMVPSLADNAPWASFLEALNHLNHPSAKGQLCLALPQGGSGTRNFSPSRPP
jgi:hypothetical protein